MYVFIETVLISLLAVSRGSAEFVGNDAIASGAFGE